MAHLIIMILNWWFYCLFNLILFIYLFLFYDYILFI